MEVHDPCVIVTDVARYNSFVKQSGKATDEFKKRMIDDVFKVMTAMD